MLPYQLSDFEEFRITRLSRAELLAEYERREALRKRAWYVDDRIFKRKCPRNICETAAKANRFIDKQNAYTLYIKFQVLPRLDRLENQNPT